MRQQQLLQQQQTDLVQSLRNDLERAKARHEQDDALIASLTRRSPISPTFSRPVTAQRIRTPAMVFQPQPQRTFMIPDDICRRCNNKGSIIRGGCPVCGKKTILYRPRAQDLFEHISDESATPRNTNVQQNPGGEPSGTRYQQSNAPAPTETQRTQVI